MLDEIQIKGDLFGSLIAVIVALPLVITPLGDNLPLAFSAVILAGVIHILLVVVGIDHHIKLVPQPM